MYNLTIKLNNFFLVILTLRLAFRLPKTIWNGFPKLEYDMISHQLYKRVWSGT